MVSGYTRMCETSHRNAWPVSRVGVWCSCNKRRLLFRKLPRFHMRVLVPNRLQAEWLLDFHVHGWFNLEFKYAPMVRRLLNQRFCDLHLDLLMMTDFRKVFCIEIIEIRPLFLEKWVRKNWPLLRYFLSTKTLFQKFEIS